MRLIKQSFEIWNQPAGLEGVYKQIEKAGRVCYKSEDKITEDSAKPFVDRMIKSGHGAMLEHGTVYMFMPIDCDKHDYHVAWKYHKNKYSKVIIRNKHFLLNKNGYYITTNFRVLVENDWLDDLKYICEPTEFHEKRVCVHFICDRGILAEFTRHRVFSFSAESTRYCNYSKDKFGNELTFIIPCWMDIPEGSINLGNYDKTSARYEDGNVHIIDTKPPYVGVDFIRSLCEAESNYLSIVRNGWKPQEARAVLPNSLKTELVMTGFISDWKHFFGLRCDSAAHPQARELAIPLREEFIDNKYL
jgi:thymidylate synthase (FAD)